MKRNIHADIFPVTIEDLQACGTLAEAGQASAAIRRKLENFKLDHVKALFATKKLAYSTTLIMWVWALIGEWPEMKCHLKVLKHANH